VEAEWIVIVTISSATGADVLCRSMNQKRMMAVAQDDPPKMQ